MPFSYRNESVFGIFTALKNFKLSVSLLPLIVNLLAGLINPVNGLILMVGRVDSTKVT